MGSEGENVDVERSVGMDQLLRRATVVELDSLGDDDDKAFFMGLLFVRLVERRKVSTKLAELTTSTSSWWRKRIDS